MVNVRLYRIAWIVAVVGTLMLLLTLGSPGTIPEPAVPPALSGVAVADATAQVQAISPTRAPGSAGDAAVGAWVDQQFATIAQSRNPVSSGATVGTQAFVARWRGRLIHGTNVYLSLPGAVTGADQLPATVIAAARDAPPGVTANAAATGMLVALAHLSASTTHQHPLIFASLDDTTVGNAGIRWLLPRVLGVRVGAVVNVDAPDEAVGNATWVWADGRDNSQSLGLALDARTAITRAGGTPAAVPGVLTQLLRLAVPQSFGDQAPAIAEGIPSVTISGRPDTPAYGPGQSGADHVATVGNAVLGLAGSIDAMTSVAGPSQSIYVAGRVLDTATVRLVLLLLIVQVLAVAVDAGIRLRRARLAWMPGLAAIGWRIAPWVIATLAGAMLARAGMLPGLSAGAVPLPEDAPVLIRSIVALVAVVVVVVVLGAWSAARLARITVVPASDVTVSLVALAALLAAIWLVRPFMLVLLIPAAQVAVLSLMATRRWHLGVFVAIALLPLLVLCWSVDGQLQRGVLYAAWYLVVTTLQGGRGALGILCGLLAALCTASVIVVADRRLRNVPQIPRPPVWDIVVATARNVWVER